MVDENIAKAGDFESQIILEYAENRLEASQIVIHSNLLVVISFLMHILEITERKKNVEKKIKGEEPTHKYDTFSEELEKLIIQPQYSIEPTMIGKISAFNFVHSPTNFRAPCTLGTLKKGFELASEVRYGYINPKLHRIFQRLMSAINELDSSYFDGKSTRDFTPYLTLLGGSKVQHGGFSPPKLSSLDLLGGSYPEDESGGGDID